MRKTPTKQRSTVRIKVSKPHSIHVRATAHDSADKLLAAFASLPKGHQQAMFVAARFSQLADKAVRYGHNRTTFINECVQGAELATKYKPTRDNKIGLTAWRAVQALGL